MLANEPVTAARRWARSGEPQVQHTHSTHKSPHRQNSNQQSPQSTQYCSGVSRCGPRMRSWYSEDVLSPAPGGHLRSQKQQQIWSQKIFSQLTKQKPRQYQVIKHMKRRKRCGKIFIFNQYVVVCRCVDIIYCTWWNSPSSITHEVGVFRSGKEGKCGWGGWPRQWIFNV